MILSMMACTSNCWGGLLRPTFRSATLIALWEVSARALAIWLWVDPDARDIRPGIDLRYKKTRAVRTNIIKHLVSRWRAMELHSVAEAAEKCQCLVESDDALDAYVSGVLAALLASRNSKVSIFGNKSLGMFLLPTNDQIRQDLTDDNLARFVR